MPLLETIKKVLSEQVQGWRLLSELLQREKVCLVNLQMEGIEALTKEKDILVLKLRLLEEERKRIIDIFILENFPDISTEGIAPQKISLLKLAELTGETIFLEMRSKLISLSQGIKELNDLNKIMIDRTLGFLKQNNTFLGMYFPGAAPLGEKGRLLSREI
ncbi:MAG: flagellar protein FlgN [Deltaproteobacteria bacterium]|nr:flagellar protein FlgN [Deltaproteobacteria bacterium]